MEWQAIETAPINKKVLVVYQRPVTGIFCSRTNGCETGTKILTDVGIGSQFRSRPGLFRIVGEDEPIKPIYWKPLDAPPEAPNA